MATDYIAVNATSQRAQRLQLFIRTLRQARDLGAEIGGELGHMAADPDYTGVEAQFGLTAGQGQPLYNLVVGANVRVNHADVTALIDRVG